jgi:hypothetical protein
MHLFLSMIVLALQATPLQHFFKRHFRSYVAKNNVFL